MLSDTKKDKISSRNLWGYAIGAYQQDYYHKYVSILFQFKEILNILHTYS